MNERRGQGRRLREVGPREKHRRGVGDSAAEGGALSRPAWDLTVRSQPPGHGLALVAHATPWTVPGRRGGTASTVPLSQGAQGDSFRAGSGVPRPPLPWRRRGQ